MATKAKYAGVTINSDGSWTYRLKVKLPNGKLIDTRIKKDNNGNPFLTAKSAYNAKREHEARIKSESIETLTEPNRATLSDVYDNYMSTIAKSKAPSTLRKQESMWINHVCPAFGDKYINEITIVELDSFLFSLYQDYSYKYVEGFLKFFYLLFGHSDRMEVIDTSKYNRMFVSRSTRLQMPKMTQSDYEDELDGAVVYSDQELYDINKVFESEEGNLLLAFRLGLYCGLRISETFALRWSNIDFVSRTITIDRQMQYIDGEIRLCSVKTLASVRKVFIPDSLFEDLEFYYSFYLQKKENLGNSYRDTDRVFDDVTQNWIIGGDFVNRKKNGELLTVNSMKYWSKKIKSELGIDFKYHNLRHTFATRCAVNNVNLQMLMSMMGHKKIDTTRKYYINTEDKYLKDTTMKLLNSMIDLSNNGVVYHHKDDSIGL